jgi:Ca-activated chloride channel family protein
MGDGLQLSIEAIALAGDSPQPTVTGGSPGPTPTPVPATKAPPASIVLLSDGQSNRGRNVLDVAEDAVTAKIKVYTIGIGTERGAPVTIQGQTTVTVLDETSLRAVAERTGGRYFNAQDSDDLRQIYDELSRERKFEDKEEEITFALTGAALILSMIAGGLGLLWFNRLP